MAFRASAIAISSFSAGLATVPKLTYTTEDGASCLSSHDKQASVGGSGGSGDATLEGPTLRSLLTLDFRSFDTGRSSSSKQFMKTAVARGRSRPI